MGLRKQFKHKYIIFFALLSFLCIIVLAFYCLDSFTHSGVNMHACLSNTARAAFLGCAKLVFMPPHFKSDDSLSPRGNIEGHCGGLCLYPDCFPLAVGCSPWGWTWLCMFWVSLKWDWWYLVL